MPILKKYISLLIFVTINCQLSAQTIDNVTARIEDKNILVSYDIINEAPGQTFDIELLYSTNGSPEYVKCQAIKCSDNQYSGINAGKNKQITWYVLQDMNKLECNTLDFKIQARVHNQEKPGRNNETQQSNGIKQPTLKEKTGRVNESQKRDKSNTISVGEHRPEGYVFYIDNTGQHGLLCTPFDQSEVTWGCNKQFLGGTSVALGSGKTNTEIILKKCQEENIAARVCDELEMYGYDDWYLPSKDELNLMYKNLKARKIGGLDQDAYWSSSEPKASAAWLQNFALLGYQLNFTKSSKEYVRCIRSF